jgi:hypothetical protein
MCHAAGAISITRVLLTAPLRTAQILALPDSIGALTSLQFLSVVGNALVTLPLSLARLTGLHHLFVNGNPLTPPLRDVCVTVTAAGGPHLVLSLLRAASSAFGLRARKRALPAASPAAAATTTPTTTGMDDLLSSSSPSAIQPLRMESSGLLPASPTRGVGGDFEPAQRLAQFPASEEGQRAWMPVIMAALAAATVSVRAEIVAARLEHAATSGNCDVSRLQLVSADAVGLPSVSAVFNNARTCERLGRYAVELRRAMHARPPQPHIDRRHGRAALTLALVAP